MSRAMFDHPLFEGRADRVGVWAWILATAAWKDTRQDVSGKTVEVKRGQLLASYRQISKATGMPLQQLRTFLGRLQTEHAINTDTSAGRLLITVCNYEKYQAKGSDPKTGDNTPATQDQHSSNTQKNKVTREQGLEPVGSSSSGDDPAGAHPVDDIAAAVEAYNRTAEASGWPTVRVLSKARRSALAARLREAGGIEGWREALRRAQASNHCNGQNSRGWVANFDFLTRQSSFVKLMEGNYDNRPAAGGYGRRASDETLAEAAVHSLRHGGDWG